MLKYIVAVDFDGTLTDDTRWRGEGVYGNPRQDAAQAMWRLHTMGCTLVIWTCRQEPEGITDWLHLHGFPPVDAINDDVSGIVKADAPYRKLIYDVLVDDRAVGWTNWRDAVDDIEGRVHSGYRATENHE